MDTKEYIEKWLFMDEWWEENVCGTFESTKNCEYLGTVIPNKFREDLEGVLSVKIRKFDNE